MLVEMLLFTAGTLSLLTAVLMLRRGVAATFPHNLLAAATGAGAFLLFALPSRQPALLGLILASFSVFVVLPAVLGLVARGLMRTDRFRAASEILLFRLPLAPSLSAFLDHRILKAFTRARHGDFDSARRIFHGLMSASAFRTLRPAVHEAFLDLCLREFRWDEAGAFLDREAEAFEASVSKAPRLLVYGLRVRAETGRIREAASFLARIVEAAPDAISWEDVTSAYLVFLGATGEVEKLQHLLSRYGAFLQGFPEAVRDIWLGRAHAVRGETERAEGWFRSALGKARENGVGLARRIERQRELATEAAEAGEAPEPVAIPWPPPLPERAPYVSPRALSGSPPQKPVATWTFLVFILVAAGLATLQGGTSDRYTLVEMGAYVRFLTEAGQIWRLGSATLLHVGWLHLLMNAMGLYFLGRLAENMYGHLRFVTIYVVSGFAGGAVSHALSATHLSAGASGAILGLFGASIAFFALYGSRLPPRARRMYLFLFLFVGAAEFFFGFAEPVIDNYAHMGGMAAGFLVGAIFKPVLGSPRKPSAPRRAFAIAAAAASVALLASCAFIASWNWFSGARIPADIPFQTVETSGAPGALRIPGHWIEVDETEEAYDRFQGPLMDMTVSAHDPTPMLTLADFARTYEVEEIRAVSGSLETLRGPRLRDLEEGVGPVLTFRWNYKPDIVRESNYLVRGNRILRFTFMAPGGALSAFETVIDRILSETIHE